MDFRTLLILAGLGYWFYSKTKELEEQIEYNKEQQQIIDAGQDDDIENASKQNDPKTLAEKYLKITPRLQFREVTAEKWSGQFLVEIKNTSNDKTFIIRRVEIPMYSCFEVNGLVLPYKDALYTLRPGASTTVTMAYNIETYFDGKNERAWIAQRLRDYVGQWLSGRCFYNVRLEVANDSNQNTTVATFSNVPGEIRLEDTSDLYYHEEGGKLTDK